MGSRMRAGVATLLILILAGCVSAGGTASSPAAAASVTGASPTATASAKASRSLIPDSPSASPTSAEMWPVAWALDPDYAVPTPGSTQLHILAWYGMCAGMALPTEISPTVEWTPSSVTITIEAPGSFHGAETCPLPPGARHLIVLTEPLGERQLLDGGSKPPKPPVAP